MMIKRGRIEQTAEHKKIYNTRGFRMTGETLTIGDERENTTYVVMTGPYTKYMMVRDCGDHYIKAGYSAYYRIDKKTLEVTKDVEDR